MHLSLVLTVLLEMTMLSHSMRNIGHCLTHGGDIAPVLYVTCRVNIEIKAFMHWTLNTSVL